MRIKYKSLFIIFSLISIFCMAINLNLVTAEKSPFQSTADNIDDPANDVVIYDNNAGTCESTSLHPELDIDTMVRSGQQITVTLYEYFQTDDYYYHTLSINDGQETYFVMYVEQLGVLLTKEAGGSWNGTGWSFSMPINIGSLSGKILTANIPNEAIAITSSMEWVFMYTYDDDSDIMYMDISPDDKLAMMCPGYDNGDVDEPDDGDDTGEEDDGDGDDGLSISDLLQRIPGYEMTSLILISFFLTIGIVYIYKKRIIIT